MLLKVNAFLAIVLGLTSCYLFITGDYFSGFISVAMAWQFSADLLNAHKEEKKK